MTRGRRSLLVLAPIVALAACQQPDVGQSCTIKLGSMPVPSPQSLAASGGGEYVEFNNVDCENLVCVLSPAAAGSKYGSAVEGRGYCSKPCVSNRDCYQSDTELVCRNMILDSTFLNELDPATKARYLGEIEFSNYCGVPLGR